MFVPVVPLTLMDVLDSPVPALVGVQAPFDPLSYAYPLDGVVVLDLDARQSSVSNIPVTSWSTLLSPTVFHGDLSRRF